MKKNAGFSFLNEKICWFFCHLWVFWLLVGQKKWFEDAILDIVMSIFHSFMTLISWLAAALFVSNADAGRNLSFSWPQPSDLVTQPNLEFINPNYFPKPEPCAGIVENWWIFLCYFGAFFCDSKVEKWGRECWRMKNWVNCGSWSAS